VRRCAGPRLALAAASLALFGGCTSLPESAVQQVRAGYDAYKARHCDRSVEQLTGVIERYPNNPEVAEALYVRSLCRLRQGQRSSARADLERALVLSRRPVLSALVRAQLANIAFDNDSFAQSARLYARAVPDLPEQPPKDRILYQYGLSLQRTGRFTDARLVFADVFAKHPTSTYASAARRKFKWGHEYFTVQCGAFTQVTSARETASRLQQNGFDAATVPMSQDGTTLFVVHSGKHSTYSAALSAVNRLRSVVPGAFVVP
jgi:tetratricopeptide (TPR) repeat protein